MGVGIGGPPALTLEKVPGSVVHQVAPRREEPHVAPVANAGAYLGPSFEHERAEATRVKVSGGGEAHWAGAENDHRQFVVGWFRYAIEVHASSRSHRCSSMDEFCASIEPI